MCTAQGEPASMVTLGKGLEHKQNVCIRKWGIGTPRECNVYSGHILFFMGVKGRGHRKVAYGLSGATGIVHCLCSKMPMKNPCNNPRGQGHAEGLWPASATTTGTTKRCHLALRPPGHSGVPTAWLEAGLPLTHCIKYRIWLKNCL